MTRLLYIRIREDGSALTVENLKSFKKEADEHKDMTYEAAKQLKALWFGRMCFALPARSYRPRDVSVTSSSYIFEITS